MTYYNYLGACFPSVFSTLRFHHFLCNRDKPNLRNKAELQFSSLQLSLQALLLEGAAGKGWQNRNSEVPRELLSAGVALELGREASVLLIKMNPV